MDDLLQASKISNVCVSVQTRSPEEAEVPLKHQLLQVIVRVLQYRMLLTGNIPGIILGWGCLGSTTHFQQCVFLQKLDLKIQFHLYH